MKGDFLIEQFGERAICLKGIGKMFYQDGFPISMSVDEMSKKGIEVSMLHVADECLKNGWSAKTTISKLREDFEIKTDWDLLERFCNSTYEEQREMIFEYLFGVSTNEVRSGQKEEPLNWFKNKCARTLNI